MSRWSDFKLGNKKLSDFGGVIMNDGEFTENYLPSLNLKSQSLVNSDGELFYGSKLDPKIIDEKIAIIDTSKFNEDEFKAWINCREQQWFNYVGDNKKIKVVRNNSLDSSLYSDGEIMELSFIAHKPYWQPIDDKIWTQNTPSVNIVYKFNINSNTDSLPLIKLECIGNKVDTKFEINGLQFNIKNMTTEIYIDCEHEAVYTLVNDEKLTRLSEFECVSLNKFKYTFPKLTMGENYFKLLKGSLSRIIINTNELYL